MNSHLLTEVEQVCDRVAIVDHGTVPDVVAAVVQGGGRVYAVEPRHESLEERFMDLLGGAPEVS